MALLHDGNTQLDLILGALRRFPDREAFRQDGRSWSYREAADVLARWAAVFKKLGLRPGEGVGLLSPNRIEVWLAQVAPALVGARYTPLHPLGSLDDHLYMCRDAELRFLLIDPAFAARGTELKEASGTVHQLLSFGPCEGAVDINALVQAEASHSLPSNAGSTDQLSWLLYTGGTTGVPKAVMMTEGGMGQVALNVTTGWDLPSERRYLAAAPLSHAACLLVTPTLMRGGCVVIQKGWDPERWMDNVARERITLSLLVPTMIYSLLDAPGLPKADLSSLQTIMYGAAPMSPSRLAEGIERIGPVFSQLYAQTESLGVISCLWRHQHVVGNEYLLTSCGQAVPGARVAIRDDQGHELPDGQLGEICVQGPFVMTGYWKQPKLSEEALGDGWLRTGDIGTRDAEGFLHIIDRKKDMIVSGGFNVFPREVEDVLTQDPSVSAAAVIGVPDEKWGEAVKALVVARPGATIDEAALIERVRATKGAIAAPKSVEVLAALPTTSVGKPDKKALRAKYWAGRTRQVN